jgi:hypothetical protein
MLHGGEMCIHRESELSQIILALYSPRRIASRLDRRDQDRDQYADDRDDD